MSAWILEHALASHARMSFERMKMCYPCSHCGACKVRLAPGECPHCHSPIEEGAVVCSQCGFSLPLPPGTSAAKLSKEMSCATNARAAEDA